MLSSKRECATHKLHHEYGRILLLPIEILIPILYSFQILIPILMYNVHSHSNVEILIPILK